MGDERSKIYRVNVKPLGMVVIRSGQDVSILAGILAARTRHYIPEYSITSVSAGNMSQGLPQLCETERYI
jgi:hypothetical protein